MFMLKEFRRFGIINCKMPADSLMWSENKTLTYYPRSFTGIFSPAAVDLEGHFYAPEKSENLVDLAKSDLYNLGLAILCIMNPDTEYFDKENKCFDLEKLQEAHENELNVFGDDPIPGYSDDLNAIVHDMLVVKPEDRPDLDEIIDNLAEQDEYRAMKKKYPQLFETQKSKEIFAINKKVKLNTSKPLTTCKKLKAAFGGILVDTKKTNNKTKKGHNRTGLSFKSKQFSQKFDEDKTQARDETMSKKSRAKKERERLKNKKEKIVGVTDKGKKINQLFDDSGYRFVTKRKPYPPCPPGYIFKPWLGTDTENASLTHGEESSGNENLFDQEKAEIVECSEKGYTLDELLGRYNKRPMNTHL